MLAPCRGIAAEFAQISGPINSPSADRTISKAASAKELFGAVTAPAPFVPRAVGTYARGCLSGGVALPISGPNWQVMRLSRNRNWGHPRLVSLLEREPAATPSTSTSTPMDAFTRAQYEWGDIRSMTLRRAGWPFDLMPPCKSVDIGESGHDRQEADRGRYQGLASNAGPEVHCHAPPPFRRALVDRCHWRPDRR